MDLQLKDKIALVTGASKGLGFETARILSTEGAKLAINSRSPERIEAAAMRISKQTGGQTVGIPGDVSSSDFAREIIEQTASIYGGLDILITNAGGPPPGSFEQFSDQEWQYAIELSFLSHMRLIRAALPLLRLSKSPSVLTVTSYSVKQPISNLVLSNSIRAATVGLTKTLALELGHESIRFNSILPAWTLTDRINDLMEDRAKTNATTIEQEIEKQAQSSPFGRFARPEEFAKVAVFLVSPVASYLTGVMLSVDGGMYKGLL